MEILFKGEKMKFFQNELSIGGVALMGAFVGFFIEREQISILLFLAFFSVIFIIFLLFLLWNMLTGRQVANTVKKWMNNYKRLKSNGQVIVAIAIFLLFMLVSYGLCWVIAQFTGIIVMPQSPLQA